MPDKNWAVTIKRETYSLHMHEVPGLVGTQVDKEFTKSVHAIPLPKWAFYHCSVQSFYTFSHHSISWFTLLLWWSSLGLLALSVIKPEKSVKEVSHSFKLLYLDCKTSAKKWQTSGHFWVCYTMYVLAPHTCTYGNSVVVDAFLLEEVLLTPIEWWYSGTSISQMKNMHNFGLALCMTNHSDL